MTYNVFGGTLNPAQPSPACSRLIVLCYHDQPQPLVIGAAARSTQA